MKRDEPITAYKRVGNKFNRLYYMLQHYKLMLEMLASHYDKAKSICNKAREDYSGVVKRNNNMSYYEEVELSEEQIKEELELEEIYMHAQFKEDTCKRAFNHTVRSMFEEIAKEDFDLF